MAHVVQKGRLQTCTVASDGHDTWVRGTAKLVHVTANAKADREFGRFLARFGLHAEVLSEGLAFWAREDGSRITYVNDTDARSAPTYYWAGKSRPAVLRKEATVYRVIGEPAAFVRLSKMWYVDGRVESVVPVRVAGAAGSGEMSVGASRRVRRVRQLRLKDGEEIPTGRPTASRVPFAPHHV